MFWVKKRIAGITCQRMDLLELLILKREDIDKFAKQLFIAFLRESKNLTQALYLPYYFTESGRAEYDSIIKGLDLLNKPLKHKTFNQTIAEFGLDFQLTAVKNSFGFTLRLGPILECKAKKMFKMSYSEVRKIDVVYPGEPVVSFVDFFIFDKSLKVENSRRKFKLSCKKTECISVSEELVRDFNQGLCAKIMIGESWNFKNGDEFCWMVDKVHGKAMIMESENGIYGIKKL